MKNLLRLVVFLTALSLPLGAGAVTTNLQSCSNNTVNNAIADASAGDVLVCPSGTATWSNVQITKDITLQGAGIDQTTITFQNCGALSSPSSYTGAFQVTGFTFTSNHTQCGYNTSTMGYIRVLGNNGFRIHHIKTQFWAGTTSTAHSMAIYTRYGVSGLFDHITFLNHPDETPECDDQVDDCSDGSLGGLWIERNGISDWSYPVGEISKPDHTIFIEDNYFRQSADSDGDGEAVLGQRGAIFVFRHNEVRNLKCGDAHGNEVLPSTKEFEFSNNECIVESGFSIYRGFYIRGGTGVMYNNTLSGTHSRGINLEETRDTSDRGSPSRPELYGGYPGGYACSNWEIPRGYSCIDTIGRGQSTGSSPNMTQTSSPLYIWNNTLVGGLVISSSSTYLQSGEEYYYSTGDQPKPGYASYTYPHPLQGAGGGGDYKPDLVSPTSGEGNVHRPVTFTWSSVDGAVMYQLQVDDNSDFSSPEVDVETPQTSYQATNLEAATKYWWRVRAR